MTTARLSVAAFACVLVGQGLPAQTLLKDINTTPETAIPSSNPACWGEGLLAGKALMGAQTPATGLELWLTDGTAAGTTLLQDVFAGIFSSRPSGASIPYHLAQLPSGEILFAAISAEHGWELWKSDGTTVGTVLVADIQPGPESSVANDLATAGNQVFFFADDGVHGIELWKSDGTAAGTSMVVDLQPGPGSISNGTAELAAVGNTGLVVFTVLFADWSSGSATEPRRVRRGWYSWSGDRGGRRTSRAWARSSCSKWTKPSLARSPG